jgi:putative transposase
MTHNKGSDKTSEHHRRSIRLPEYDYTQPGVYFVTLVTYQRECLFGSVDGPEIHLTSAGEIALACWREIPAHFPNVILAI